MTPEMWDYDHFLSIIGWLDENYAQHSVDAFIDVIKRFNPNIVVDSFNPAASIASRVCGRPLVSVTQGDIHPANKGFIWWKEPPADIPSPVAVFNSILAKYELEPISNSSQLSIGDLTLCAGTPETDPIPKAPEVIHLGPMFAPHLQDELPDWFDQYDETKPLLWVYCGNPRYMGIDFHGPGDSIVILRVAYEVLAEQDVNVIVTFGHQERPDDLPSLPNNFREENYLPGISLAKRCNLMIHHGGHNSCLLSAFTGTPSLVVPTFSERESNARRLEALGIAELQVPTVDDTGEKHISTSTFEENVHKILTDISYKNNAEAVSKLMAKYDELGTVVERIEALL